MILFAYGTRPEYIKIKSILDHIEDIPHKILFTGQHKDLCNGKFDFEVKINDGPNRLDSIIQSQLNLPNEIFDGVKYVLVQGDTTSAMALALAAFNREIPVIHLEAGLRTYNKLDPYPEETNRQIISKIASVHLCPTHLNAENLEYEGVDFADMYQVGNTGLDNIHRPTTTTYNSDVIITLHRRENHKYLPLLFQTLNKIAKENKELNFIIPLHPNPNVQKHKHLLTDVKIIDPVPHDEMIKLVTNCRFLISDSGGLQEEASFLNKKIIVCRKTTERPESIGIHSILCDDYEKLESVFNSIKDNYIIDANCPYGNGYSYKEIIPILRRLVKDH